MRALLITTLVLAGAGSAAAQQAPQTSAASDRILTCRSIAEAASRLACYDAAAAAFAQAQEAGQVVVMDVEDVREARRGLFGLNLQLPSLAIFGAGDEAEQITEQDYVIRSVRQSASGDWVFTMEDGTVWRQNDGNLSRRPRAGDPAHVTRRALGSYSMNVNGARAIWVERVQ